MPHCQKAPRGRCGLGMQEASLLRGGGHCKHSVLPSPYFSFSKGLKPQVWSPGAWGRGFEFLSNYPTHGTERRLRGRRNKRTEIIRSPPPTLGLVSLDILNKSHSQKFKMPFPPPTIDMHLWVDDNQNIFLLRRFPKPKLN